MGIKTPVALFIYKRPALTAKVFSCIAQMHPEKLLIVADGPSDEAEVDKCKAARKITEQIDWECEVLRNYADFNLGCRRRVSSGLDWVFEECEEAVILEDDCVPVPSFFPFCAEMLANYHQDERVMMITGQSFLDNKSFPYSYCFSRFNFIWGWASWRRAWQHYDVNMELWPQRRESSWLLGLLQNAEWASAWQKEFDKVYRGYVDTWDRQWTFACWLQQGLTIVPHKNMITNIGFSEDATHTKQKNAFSAIPAKDITFPLRHPPKLSWHKEADEYMWRRRKNLRQNSLDKSDPGTGYIFSLIQRAIARINAIFVR